MAENEYIERDRIVKFIETGLNDPDKVKAFGHDAVEILAEIHLAPAADVVEVVRCENCKHYGTSWCAMDTYAFDVVEEGFCSYGERKAEIQGPIKRSSGRRSVAMTKMHHVH